MRDSSYKFFFGTQFLGRVPRTNNDYSDLYLDEPFLRIILKTKILSTVFVEKLEFLDLILRRGKGDEGWDVVCVGREGR